MAVHGKKAVLKIANAAGVLTSLYGKTNSVDFPEEVETHDTTTHGANSRQYTVGLKDSSLSFEGFWDSTVDAHLGGILAVDDRAWEFYPEGEVSGKVKYSGVGCLTSFGKNSDVGDVIPFSGEFQVDGDVTRGTVA